jgi:hypothetical protein
VTLASTVCVRDPHVPILNPAVACPERGSNNLFNFFRGGAWIRVKTLLSSSLPFTTARPFVTLQFVHLTLLLF